MTNDAIEFPYRGWLIRVTFDAAGWTAQAKHPRGKNFATIQSSYAFAADAIQAAVHFVTWANPSRAMQQLLIELRDNQHLNQQEYQHLYVSFEKGMQHLFPLKTKPLQEYES
ncbi:hypothetical protein [Trichocoleus sp. FACHB-262]|uniref:hypothetical protein n=1 Tax=Trichocoleus sp. FACHB-262 TaxID=2692869 RepID=UPI00168696C8|nr:hypothetical protein [Trichocoleus sp. FACHB-262]MBD2119311.1 hypothetical protein [Trichocoleus sp. FACHB-262]